jgi:hypothetical protein
MAKGDSKSSPPSEAVKLWHEIIDAEAEYENRLGHPPHLLELPTRQAYELAKLRHDQLGPLAQRVMSEGVGVFEQEGLLNIPVKLVGGGSHFSFE